MSHGTVITMSNLDSHSSYMEFCKCHTHTHTHTRKVSIETLLDDGAVGHSFSVSQLPDVLQ